MAVAEVSVEYKVLLVVVRGRPICSNSGSSSIALSRLDD